MSRSLPINCESILRDSICLLVRSGNLANRFNDQRFGVLFSLLSPLSSDLVMTASNQFLSLWSKHSIHPVWMAIR